VKASWAANDTVVSLAHGAFEYETLYTFLVVQARDRALNPLDFPVAWSFVSEPNPCEPVQGVAVEGPADVAAGQVAVYTGAYSPLTASQPVTLTWDNGALGATAIYSWTLPGTYTVAITATNACGEVGGSQAVAVREAAHWVYLPAGSCT
jgi:PKD repeat protein